MATKQMQLNFFDTTCTGTHQPVGTWRDPNDNTRTKDRLGYWQWMAKLAEKGKITSIFLADTYSFHDVYQADVAAQIRGGSQIGQLDPTIVVSAMAAVSRSVGFGITGSTSYLNPFIVARTWGSLDHITDGRAGWNVVTSYQLSAAKAMGKESVLSSEERYAAADEFLELDYTLWEGCWEDDAQVWDKEGGTAYDPAKIHHVDFRGKHFQMSGRHQTHPSPQRTPVIFQAGASKSGIAFAGKHAEALFCGSLLPASTARYVASVRGEATKHGRDPGSLKFFAGLCPVIGRTAEEARAKAEGYRQHADVEGGLAKFSGYTNIDMSKYPLDEPFRLGEDAGMASNVIQGIINNFRDMGEDEVWTPRKLGEKMALGGLFPMPVGTAEMVADEMQRWVKETDIDGFNIAYLSNPDTFESVVELLVPELQRRGLMWTEYPVPGGTLRENMYGVPGQKTLPDDHPGAKFRWNAKKSE